MPGSQDSRPRVVYRPARRDVWRVVASLRAEFAFGSAPDVFCRARLRMSGAWPVAVFTLYVLEPCDIGDSRATGHLVPGYMAANAIEGELALDLHQGLVGA
jgi:hypothetical protein